MTKAELWRLAEQKAAHSPHGQKRERERVMREITTALLEAELKPAA